MYVLKCGETVTVATTHVGIQPYGQLIRCVGCPHLGRIMIDECIICHDGCRG